MRGQVSRFLLLLVVASSGCYSVSTEFEHPPRKLTPADRPVVDRYRLTWSPSIGLLQRTLEIIAEQAVARSELVAAEPGKTGRKLEVYVEGRVNLSRGLMIASLVPPWVIPSYEERRLMVSARILEPTPGESGFAEIAAARAAATIESCSTLFSIYFMDISRYFEIKEAVDLLVQDALAQLTKWSRAEGPGEVGAPPEPR